MTRRVLVAEWPALSRLFGLHPWDLPRLTSDELYAYLEAKAGADGG